MTLFVDRLAAAGFNKLKPADGVTASKRKYRNIKANDRADNFMPEDISAKLINTLVYVI